eukprot:2104192-Rhodomonas_salina.1
MSGTEIAYGPTAVRSVHAEAARGLGRRGGSGPGMWVLALDVACTQLREDLGKCGDDIAHSAVSAYRYAVPCP